MRRESGCLRQLRQLLEVCTISRRAQVAKHTAAGFPAGAGSPALRPALVFYKGCFPPPEPVHNSRYWFAFDFGRRAERSTCHSPPEGAGARAGG